MSRALEAPRLRLERRDVQLLLLTIAAAAGAYARTALGPLQEAMRVSIPLSDNQIAWLQGPALALPLVIAATPLGLLIDRYSRVRLFIFSTALTIAGSALSAWAPDFSSLFLVRLLVGLSSTAVNPLGLSLLADWYAPAQRGRATMVMAVGLYGGMAASFALGGTLLADFGAANNGWRHAMLALCVPLIPVLLLTFAMREPPRTDVVVKNPSLRQSFAELWRYRASLAVLLLGGLAIEMAIGATFVWSAPSLARSFALGPERVGAIVAAALLVSGIVGPIMGGFLADLCQRAGGPRRTYAAVSALALVSSPAGAFALMPATEPAAVLLVIYVTIAAAAVVMTTTLITVVLPNELRGLCISISVGASALFSVGVAPVLVSALSDAYDGDRAIGSSLATIVIAMSVVGAAAFAWGRRYVPAGDRDHV